MRKIVYIVVADMVRNKIMLFYTGLLLVLTFSIFSIEGNTTKSLLSMLNLLLIITPMVSLLFSTIYWYNSVEFIELMVSQPLERKKIWLSFFVALSASLVIAFFVGAGIMVLWMEPTRAGLMLVFIGVFLSIIFCAIASWVSVHLRDKAKGIGVGLLVWLYFSLLFDGLVLFLIFQFIDYPIERPMIFLSMLNPIDLARIVALLQMDAVAMMGFTGAVFKDFFGTLGGMGIVTLVMILWILIPSYWAMKKFEKKDL